MLDSAASFGTVLHVHVEYYFNVSMARAQFRQAHKENTLLPFTEQQSNVATVDKLIKSPSSLGPQNSFGF